jgi:hypothetical protein
MNWWLDLGRVYLFELIGKTQFDEASVKPIKNTLSRRIDGLEKENPYAFIIEKTLKNNPLINPFAIKEKDKNKKIEKSFKNIEGFLKTISDGKGVYCSFCGEETETSKDSIASRKWIVSGGWEDSPLYAGGGTIPPRICLNCRKLSLLAAFKAYELFLENRLPFIIYNPDTSLYKKLLDNLLLRKDLNLNFEKASSIFLSLGSMLIYPEFDNKGNISGFDLRPLLPKASLMLMNLTGILRAKNKEQYILDVVEKHREKSGSKLVADFLKKQSKLSLSEVITAFYAFVKAYKGGIGMTKEFFDLGKELGNNLSDKAYSVALKLYKSLRDSTQLQKQLIGSYIYLKKPMPKELTQITESEDHALAFIMGIMNTIQK